MTSVSATSNIAAKASAKKTIPATMANVLVARQTGEGRFEKVDTGRITVIGFTFPIASLRSEEEWNRVESAAHWLFNEPAARFLDLDCGLRVSLF